MPTTKTSSQTTGKLSKEQQAYNNILEFIQRASKEVSPGGAFHNAGLAVPVDARFDTLIKALDHKPLRDAIFEKTGIANDTIDFLVELAKKDNKSSANARMLLSMVTAIGARGNPELQRHLEDNQIITGTRIPAMLVYLHKYNVTNPKVLREHIERATWYVQPLTAKSQRVIRDAAFNVFKKITGDERMASDMAKKITLDNEQQTNEMFELMSHSHHSNEEAERADLARAIFLAKNKPYFPLFIAALGPTSIQSPPSSNFITALTSVIPLLSGHRSFGVAPSMSLSTSVLSSHGIAKLQGILELSRMALGEVDTPEHYRPAVDIIKRFVNNLKDGVEYNGKLYKMTDEEITPESLTAAFLVAQHNTDDLFKVWGAASHMKNKIFATHALYDTMQSYVISPLHKYADIIEKETGNTESAQAIRKYANEIDEKLHSSLTEYIRTGKTDKLKDIAPDIDKIIAASTGTHHTSSSSSEFEGIEKTKRNISSLIRDLESKDTRIPDLKEQRKNTELVTRPEIREYNKLPGLFGLGPKIGPYTATLAGNNRTYVIDTWMYRLGTIKPKVKRASVATGQKKESLTSLADIQFEHYPHLLKTLYDDDAKSQASEALNIAFSKDNRLPQNVLSTIKKTFTELGIPHRFSPHILSSDSSNQSWAWHLVRWSIAAGKPKRSKEYDITSTLHGMAEYITKNPDTWHLNSKMTFKNPSMFEHRIPVSWRGTERLMKGLSGTSLFSPRAESKETERQGSQVVVQSS